METSGEHYITIVIRTAGDRVTSVAQGGVGIGTPPDPQFSLRAQERTYLMAKTTRVSRNIKDGGADPRGLLNPAQ